MTTASALLNLLFPNGSHVSPGASSPETLPQAQARIASQYEAEMSLLQSVPRSANAFRDAVLAFETAAGLGARDYMTIYGVTATAGELAGAGLQAFLGFFDKRFRDHDYDVGRLHARQVLNDAALTQPGAIGPLHYTGSDIRRLDERLAGLKLRDVPGETLELFKVGLRRRLHQTRGDMGPLCFLSDPADCKSHPRFHSEFFDCAVVSRIHVTCSFMGKIMLRPNPAFVLTSAILICSATGCDTPDAVTQFCASSTSTLTSAIPIFRDLQASCLREVNLLKGIGTFVMARSDPGCDAIGVQAKGAVAAAQMLTAYFTAINSIATFGTATIASDASDLVSATGSALGAGSAAQTAIGSIATFLTTALTTHYQQRALSKDLARVSKNIGDITDGLVQIVRVNYIDQELETEEEKLASRYREFAQQQTNGAVILELDDRWHEDVQKIATRKASAEALIISLHTIKELRILLPTPIR